MTSTDIPAGFEPHFRKAPLTDPWEPLYSRKTDNGVTVGLRLANPHTNARGLIQGGWIAALADAAMGYSCAQATGWTTSLVTISLSVDYVGAGEIGQWLAVAGGAIKTGSTICCARCLAKAHGAVIARAWAPSASCRRRAEGVTQPSAPRSPPRDRRR